MTCVGDAASVCAWTELKSARDLADLGSARAGSGGGALAASIGAGCVVTRKRSTRVARAAR